MTACPVCNKPVDPLRARFVAVRAGKVTAYCSPECRDAQDTKPTKAPVPATPEITKPKTPAAGTPKSTLEDLESGPVIEILHEPASGVVTSAKDERVTQPTGKFDKEEVVEAKETKPRTDGSKGSGGADSAAAAGEIGDKKRQRTRPSGKHLTRERKDSTEAKAGWDWLDDEPAEHARPGTVTESERRARWPFLVVLIIVALGAGGFVIVKYFLDKEKRARGATQPIGPGTSAQVTVDAMEVPLEPDAEAITKEVAVRRAKELLRGYLEKGTTRVQRMAAGALGRTGDPGAVAALQQAVKQEKVPAARFKLAYELARAGDKQGREALFAGLNERERSDKLDAAAKLAQLGDDRAKSLLASLLTMEQHQLRAAEELARLKDPAADKFLEQVRSDPKSSTDEKATATIALFRGGRAELADDVRKLLEVDSWKAPAAYALGEAKDESAKPILIEQLANTIGVKVRAAYALRKLLGDKTDEVIPSLVDALSSQKDQEQIMVAEAILILAGEPQWAEYR